MCLVWPKQRCLIGNVRGQRDGDGEHATGTSCARLLPGVLLEMMEKVCSQQGSEGVPFPDGGNSLFGIQRQIPVTRGLGTRDGRT